MELMPGNRWQSRSKQSGASDCPATPTTSESIGQSEHTETEPSNCNQQSGSSDRDVDTANSSSDVIILSSECPEKTSKPKEVLPEMIPKPGTEFRFSKLPTKPYREGATPSEVTRYSLDSSYSVAQIVAEVRR